MVSASFGIVSCLEAGWRWVVSMGLPSGSVLANSMNWMWEVSPSMGSPALGGHTVKMATNEHCLREGVVQSVVVGQPRQYPGGVRGSCGGSVDSPTPRRCKGSPDNDA